ncbi:MAG: hypothetical protein ACJ8F7_09775, partial [Gemmataceae bacterium]
MRLIRMIAALASVAALAMAIRADEPKAAVPPELEWLPPNSAGFVHVRIHDLLSSPAGRKLIETAKAADPKAIDSVELGLGVPLSRIESVTLLVPTINARASEPAIVIRINTTKPYDRRDVRAALRARPIGEGLGDDSDLLKLEGRGVAHFSGERSLTLIPDEAGADGLLSQFLSHKPAGPLTAALQQAGGKSQIVAGVNVATLPRVPVEAFPPDLKPLRTLLDAKTLTITGTLADDKTEFAFRVSFGSKEDATEGNQAVTDGLKALQMLLAKAEMETKADSEETRAVKALMKEVLAGLKAAEVSQKDAEIVVAMRLE